MLEKIFHKNFNLFNNKVIFIIIVFLMISLFVDTSFIRSYDLINKNITPIETREVIFSLNISICISLQFLILRYMSRITRSTFGNTANFRHYSKLAELSYYWLIIIISFLIFQLFYFSYYNSYVLMIIVLTTYGVASILIGNVCVLFISWYKVSHHFMILMYFVSMALIIFNLVSTNLLVNISLADRPVNLREFEGGSMDISAGKYDFLVYLQKVSSILSFVSMWLTTALLMHSSTDRLMKEIRYWILPILLLIYFLTSYFSQDIFTPILTPFLSSEPILLSLSLIIIFTLTKPIGGIMFGLTFYNISRRVSYEKTLKDFIIISGYGFLLLFSANQSTSLVLGPYPPFGISTITILIIGSYLIMVGIYKSATLISANVELRKSIYEIAKESKLLHLIGTAEMEKEISKTVSKIMDKTNKSQEPPETSRELDEQELKNYLDEVIEEMRKNRDN